MRGGGSKPTLPPAHTAQVLCLTWPRKGKRAPRGGTCHPGVVSASWATLGTPGNNAGDSVPRGLFQDAGSGTSTAEGRNWLFAELDATRRPGRNGPGRGPGPAGQEETRGPGTEGDRSRGNGTQGQG